ncbi:MAG: tyrosine--tRNA ligase [Clostridia bacterium]|nr:tyrosine--tRNA ligase [Clostridia bacterium]
MKVYEELKERGLIAQTTDEDKIRSLLNERKIKFYIGFDPTANSLHIGHFAQMIVMAHLQKFGHTPIVLFGGGTAMVGDPSGKTGMRKMLTKEQIDYNIFCFEKQMSKFISFDDDKAIMINNASWLWHLNYIDFLRKIGIHFPVNRMLAAECYKQRLETGLSFFEINYMIMQSYDFLVLSDKYNCQLELGGNDQWSNILAGIDLIRKKRQKEVYGMTFNLLTTNEGKKMGKTENGALWLDPNKTSPFDFYQYWRNIKDDDVSKCLKMLTFLSLDEINRLSKLQGNQINEAKEILAFEVTKLVHGKNEAKKVAELAKTIFINDTVSSDISGNIPTNILYKSYFKNGKIFISDLLVFSNITNSKSEARRLIEQGGISFRKDNTYVKIDSINYEIDISLFINDSLIIKKGKKTFIKVRLK